MNLFLAPNGPGASVFWPLHKQAPSKNSTSSSLRYGHFRPIYEAVFWGGSGAECNLTTPCHGSEFRKDHTSTRSIFIFNFSGWVWFLGFRNGIIILFERSEFLIATCNKKKTHSLCVCGCSANLGFSVRSANRIRPKNGIPLSV